jgi:hypothetical protein
VRVTNRALAAAVVAALLVGCPTPEPTLEERYCTWQDHPANPLIHPPSGEELLGDPTVLSPDETPDGRWHMFANSLAGIHHYASDDGITWDRLQLGVVTGSVMRPHVFVEDGRYHLLYEHFADFSNSVIERRSSDDLEDWSDAVVVIEPELEWETTPQATVGNPYLAVVGGEYRLYYSASGAELPDTGFPEPLYVGMATASDPEGPWTKRDEPVIEPEDDDPWRNHGAGSLKLLDERGDGLLVALNNGIYVGDDGVTGSAIRVLISSEGESFRDLCGEPALRPSLQEDWKQSFIYGFDTVRYEGVMRAWYNARDGWVPGVERIGMATLVEPEGE